MLFASVTDSFFDMAVKLASAGAFGICIFAILWAGWLMKSTPENAKNRHSALRNFMIMCVVIAVIAGTVGIIDSLGKNSQNTYFSREIKDLEEKHQEEKNTLGDKFQLEREGFKKVIDEHKKVIIMFNSKLEGILIGKTELLKMLPKENNKLQESLTKLDMQLAELAKLANEK